MFLNNIFNLIFIALVFLNVSISLAFGSSSVSSTTDDMQMAKQKHVDNMAVQSGDPNYFLLHHGKELLELSEKRLRFLERKQYFSGALRFEKKNGDSELGPDGQLMIGKCPLPEYQKWDIHFLHKGEGLKLFPAAFIYYSSITSITLCYNGIVALPGEISFLKKLKFLDVSYNKLSRLPNGFRQLKVLGTLNLEGNSIRKFPEVICDLERLQSLNLSFNRLEKLPEEFSYLGELRHLNLAGNEFKELSESIGELPNILSIIVRNNNLMGIPLPCLNLETLVRFDLSNNYIKLAIVGEVDEYEALKAKAASCLISISGNIEAENQAVELVRIWHENNNRSRIQETASAAQLAQ